MNVVKAIGWRKLRFRFDWTLTLSALTVAALGLVNLWSAVHERQSQPVHAADLVAGAGRGGVPGRRGVRLPQHRAARLRRSTAIGVALLLAVLVFGKMVGGGRRWFDLGAVPPAAVRADAAADRSSRWAST